MSKSTTISGTVTQTVYLGIGGIASTLTVTDTGLVLPEIIMGNIGSYGDIGVEVRARLISASITNMGTISGGAGGFEGGSTLVNGGIGINVAGTNATIANGGLIIGGVGAYTKGFAYAASLNGGVGVDLTGAGLNVSNTGAIAGGAGGGSYGNNGGAGGMGVTVLASGTLTNSGTILGGTGGSSTYFGTGGDGGAGLNLDARGASATNMGDIFGGSGGVGGYIGPYFAPRGEAGNGANVALGDHLTNNGTIAGNYGVVASQSASITNNGTIYSSHYGSGVKLETGATMANSGSITGGSDFVYRGSSSGPSGVSLDAGTKLTNTGTITGGVLNGTYNYGNGGAGVTAAADAVILNEGLIVGGPGYSSGISIRGGAGVSLTQAGTLINQSLIMGGMGGAGVAGDQAHITNDGTIIGGLAIYRYSYEPGASGVDLNYCRMTNSGFIEGSSSTSNGANSGVGVTMDHSTLTTSGTISGGVYNGLRADALTVQFGSTLIVDPGAVFNGVVSSNIYTGNTLELAGTSGGTLSGLGTQFTDFGTLRDDAGAIWTVTESNDLGSSTSLVVAGVLNVSGSLTDGAQAKITAGGVMTVTAGGSTLIKALELAGGALTGSTMGSIAIGSDPTGLSAGHIAIEAGASISGYGAVNGANEVIDNGTIIARAGTLTVGVPVTGAGALDIANGATLQVGGAVNVASLNFDAGTGETLYVAKPSALESTINGFATGDKIDLKGIEATTITFLAGTLTLYNGATAVDTLTFSGNLTQADFTIGNDGAGGTDILFGGVRENGTSQQNTERPDVSILFHHTGTWI